LMATIYCDQHVTRCDKIAKKVILGNCMSFRELDHCNFGDTDKITI